MIKSEWRKERDDRAPWGHVNKDSLLYSLPFFLALSVYLYSSLPSPDDSGSSQIIASLSGVFSLSLAHPSPACSLPLALSCSFLSCFLPPSSLLRSSLPQSLFEPSGRRSAKCQERKEKEARGRVGVRKGERVVREMEEWPLVKPDEGATETCRPVETSRRTERESKGGFQAKHSLCRTNWKNLLLHV